MIEERIATRLTESGIDARYREGAGEAVEAEDDAERLARARAEMDDDERARHERLQRDLDDLRRALERARERVGVDPRELRHVVGVALERARISFDEAAADPVGDVKTFRFDPHHPAFAADPSWADAFDDLRRRRRKRGERIGEWRKSAPMRAIAFEPPILPDGRDATDVVQVHLEHRLVRRLLSRFLSQGFQSDLERACVVLGPGAQPRVVLLGRLALYGPGAARLHEEIIPVTAIWTEVDRDRKPLRPLGDRGEETTLDQLEDALRDTRRPPAMALARVRALAHKDIEDLAPDLKQRAEQRIEQVKRDLVTNGEREANSLRQLLEAQRDRIRKAQSGFDPNQLMLPGVADEERRQREADRRHWAVRLERLERELADEPVRVRACYEVRADRLEPVGLVYLWPVTG